MQKPYRNYLFYLSVGQSDCLSFKTFDVMQLLNQILIEHMGLVIWEKDTYRIKRDCISHSEVMSTEVRRLAVVHSQLQTTPETTETWNIQTLSEASEHSAQGGTKNC